MPSSCGKGGNAFGVQCEPLPDTVLLHFYFAPHGGPSDCCAAEQPAATHPGWPAFCTFHRPLLGRIMSRHQPRSLIQPRVNCTLSFTHLQLGPHLALFAAHAVHDARDVVERGLRGKW